MAGTRQTFVVPATAGQYAPEVLYCRASSAIQDRVRRVSVFVESLPTLAQIEVEVLKRGGDPTNSGDWLSGPVYLNATGLAEDLNFADWLGVRLRAKSGGSAGSAVVDATWY